MVYLCNIFYFIKHHISSKYYTYLHVCSLALLILFIYYIYFMLYFCLCIIIIGAVFMVNTPTKLWKRSITDHAISPDLSHLKNLEWTSHSRECDWMHGLIECTIKQKTCIYIVAPPHSRSQSCCKSQPHIVSTLTQAGYSWLCHF